MIPWQLRWRRTHGRSKALTAPNASDVAVLRRTSLRIGAQVTLAVAVIVALLAGVSVLVVLRAQTNDENKLVRDTVERADDVNDPPPDVWITMQRGNQRVSTSGIPAWLPDDAPLNQVANSTDPKLVLIEQLETNGHEYLVRTQRRGDVMVQVALDRHSDEVERYRLALALASSGGLGLILAALAGVWFGRRVVGPLASALTLQRRFVADASHELRTPLTLLSTRAQLVQRQLLAGADARTLRADMGGLVTDARHLAEILDDLLLAADPRGEAPAESVDLVELVQAVVAANAPAADDDRLGIRYDRPDRAVMVTGNRAGLRRALTALVDNALQHARGEVVLTVVHSGGQAIVEVHDDGRGIDPEILPRLFERFASTSKPAGERRRYGIGLALVNEIAARHGGGIDAANGADGGATFRLTLPMSPGNGGDDAGLAPAGLSR